MSFLNRNYQAALLYIGTLHGLDLLWHVYAPFKEIIRASQIQTDAFEMLPITLQSGYPLIAYLLDATQGAAVDVPFPISPASHSSLKQQHGQSVRYYQRVLVYNKLLHDLQETIIRTPLVLFWASRKDAKWDIRQVNRVEHCGQLLSVSRPRPCAEPLRIERLREAPFQLDLQAKFLRDQMSRMGCPKKRRGVDCLDLRFGLQSFSQGGGLGHAD